MLVFLETLTGTVHHLQPITDLLFHLLSHISLCHLDTVDIGLMEEELVDGYLLGDGTVGVAIPFHTFHRSLHTQGFHIRLQDSLIAYHPDHLVDHGMLRHGKG